MKSLLYTIFGALILLIVALHGEEMQLASEAEPLGLVHGCVNVITGGFVHQRTDLLVQGPSSISLSRVYDSCTGEYGSSLGYGHTWSIARDLCSPGPLPNKAILEEREGIFLNYLKTPNGDYTIHPDAFKLGYTSYSPGEITGVNSLHNMTLTPQGCATRILNRQNGRIQVLWEGEWAVTLGCGTKRIYSWVHHDTGVWWTLTKEIRPDGNRVLYAYDSSRKLRQVSLVDSSEAVTMLNYALEYNGDRITASGSNGQKVNYTKQDFRMKIPNKTGWNVNRLACVEGDHLPWTSYKYAKGSPGNNGKLEWIDQSGQRKIRIEYDQWGNVSKLHAPIGHDTTLHTLATFAYWDNNRLWRGPQGQYIKYVLDGNNRVSSIEKVNQGQLYNKTCYWWGNEGKAAGNLLAKVIYDSSGRSVHSLQRTHDEFGNVTREVLGGNLTGRSSAEGYAIDRTFLPTFNVVTEEKGGDNLKTRYQYKEGTNLLIAKLKGLDKNISREFFTYDRFANQTLHIVDNGSGDDPNDLSEVTVRTLTYIKPIRIPLSPAFGKPETITHKYWEKGEEKLLSMVGYCYDLRGYPSQEDHYDANEEYLYSLKFTYDAAGRLLEETNALGETTQYRYDANGNRTQIHNLATGLITDYTYDFANRLIKETERHPHRSYETVHRYDLSSRRVATIDPFGHETKYSYNDLNQLTSITHPVVDGKNGIEKFSYNALGQQISRQDVLGQITHTTYTVRGQPIQITYPDGSKETYEYNSNGTLAKHTAVNGVTTITYHDPQIRPARKCYHDADDNYLYDTYATFQGEYLATETDAMGVVTRYTYDGAGRLISTRKGDHRTTLSYDALGRQHKTSEWIDSTTSRVTTREYDLLNRITEERVEEYSLDYLTQNLISLSRYGYDRYGNRCSILEGNNLTQITHDSRHRPIQILDALGHKTIIEYEETPPSPLQRPIP